MCWNKRLKAKPGASRRPQQPIARIASSRQAVSEERPAKRGKWLVKHTPASTPQAQALPLGKRRNNPRRKTET
jgi:hypothetical protein